MKIRELMTKSVMTCSPNDTLNVAADVMWKNDCGCVPVVDEGSKVVGMLTDRDVAMAAYTQGRLLTEIPVATAMATKVLSCRADDDVNVAEQIMRVNKIRRVPVVDGDGHLQGLLSLDDIARAAIGPRRVGAGFVQNVASTLAFASRPRPERAR